jgi:hypothetical protein
MCFKQELCAGVCNKRLVIVVRAVAGPLILHCLRTGRGQARPKLVGYELDIVNLRPAQLFAGSCVKHVRSDVWRRHEHWLVPADNGFAAM